jgi:hypothetical protein
MLDVGAVRDHVVLGEVSMFRLNPRVLFCAALSLMAAAAFAQPASTQTRRQITIYSPRDVDVVFVQDALIVLAQSGGRWTTMEFQRDGALHTRCALPGRSWFSLDRKSVISVFVRARAMMEVIDPVSCEVRSSIETDTLVSDGDANALSARVVSASREGGARAITLRGITGERIAGLGTARNAEIGFTPDGNTVVNFDHAGGKHQFWRAADGAPLPSPFSVGDDIHFTLDGKIAFATQPGTLTRYAWHDGIAHDGQTIAVEAREVMRGASARGSSVLMQSPNAAEPAAPIVRLLDTKTQDSFELGRGHIDATALSADGRAAAIAIRAARSNAVTITVIERAALFTP